MRSTVQRSDSPGVGRQDVAQRPEAEKIAFPGAGRVHRVKSSSRPVTHLLDRAMTTTTTAPKYAELRGVIHDRMVRAFIPLDPEGFGMRNDVRRLDAQPLKNTLEGDLLLYEGERLEVTAFSLLEAGR
jgi:hypothetical protein